MTIFHRAYLHCQSFLVNVSSFISGSHVSLPKYKRQSFLRGKYHFSCQCTACVNDFPLLHNMALANVPEFPSYGNVSQLEKAFAENIFRKCCAYLQKYYHHYPCREIYSAQMCLSKMLSCMLMNVGMFQRFKRKMFSWIECFARCF